MSSTTTLQKKTNKINLLTALLFSDHPFTRENSEKRKGTLLQIQKKLPADEGSQQLHSVHFTCFPLGLLSNNFPYFTI